MNVGVYSLKNVLFQGEAKSINCKTRAGEITILDNHRPLIGILESGAIKSADEKGEKREIFKLGKRQCRRPAYGCRQCGK